MKLALIVSLALVLTACASQVAPKESPGAQADQVVSINSFKFSPETVTIKVGQTVLWKNEEKVSHTIAIDGVESDELFQGDAWTHTFDEAGTYEYVCGIHPSMKGTVVVEE